jgi:enamine deaminase RidA (YjgF/YER057c/UK114 family)
MQSFYHTLHFAPAVIDGQHVRCSGMIGVELTENTSLAKASVPADPEAQFALAFDNLKEVLAAAGASFADVTEMTTFHVGLQQHMRTFMKVKDRYLAEPYPAWTAIGITELAVPGALVEIRITARLPE